MLKSLFVLCLFAACVFAQSTFIGLPTFNQTVDAGSSLVVQVQRPDTLTGSDEVAVVIGLQSCANRACIPPSEYLGTVLYNGPFNPQFHEPFLPPYQNFTVQIPSTIAVGTALIGVAHFSLVGAGYYPFLEVLNQTITIAQG